MLGFGPGLDNNRLLEVGQRRLIMSCNHSEMLCWLPLSGSGPSSLFGDENRPTVLQCQALVNAYIFCFKFILISTGCPKKCTFVIGGLGH